MSKFAAGPAPNDAPGLASRLAAGLVYYLHNCRGTNMSTKWQAFEPTRAEIDAGRGPLLLEFGSPTCGHCRAALPLVEQVLGEHAPVMHLKIADGPRQPQGRSFKVKLWPTLVFLHDGEEVARLVRPRELAPLRRAMTGIVEPA